MHSQQPPGVVQNWSTLQCSKQNTEQCGYDHAPVTRGRMRAQFPLPHGPWEKTKVLCPLCSQWHRGTPHARLVHCSAWSPVFLREWVRTWGPSEDMAQRWLDQALPEDLDHISKLRILQSFIDIVPRERLRELRYRVAWHQYHMMHATTLLRQSLPMRPRIDGTRSNVDSRSTPIWYTKLRRRVVFLNPDDAMLRA